MEARGCDIHVSGGGYRTSITPAGGYRRGLAPECLAVSLASGQWSTDSSGARRRATGPSGATRLHHRGDVNRDREKIPDARRRWRTGNACPANSARDRGSSCLGFGPPTPGLESTRAGVDTSFGRHEGPNESKTRKVGGLRHAQEHRRSVGHIGHARS